MWSCRKNLVSIVPDPSRIMWRVISRCFAASAPSRMRLMLRLKRFTLSFAYVRKTNTTECISCRWCSIGSAVPKSILVMLSSSNCLEPSSLGLPPDCSRAHRGLSFLGTNGKPACVFPSCDAKHKNKATRSAEEMEPETTWAPKCINIYMAKQPLNQNDYEINTNFINHQLIKIANRIKCSPSDRPLSGVSKRNLAK